MKCPLAIRDPAILPLPCRVDVQRMSWLERKTMLNRLTSLADVANAAAFMVSDHAGAMTACAANITCGSVPTR